MPAYLFILYTGISLLNRTISSPLLKGQGLLDPDTSRITPRGTADFNEAPNLADQIVGLANTILNFLTLLAGILAVAYLIWAGILYITSGSSADRAKTARAGIINAVIGIIVIVTAYFIIRFAIGSAVTLTNIPE